MTPTQLIKISSILTNDITPKSPPPRPACPPTADHPRVVGSKMRLGVRHAESPPLAERESIPRGGGSVRPERSRRVDRTEPGGVPLPGRGAAHPPQAEAGSKGRARGGPHPSLSPPPIIPTPPTPMSSRTAVRDLGRGGAGLPTHLDVHHHPSPDAGGGPHRPTLRICPPNTHICLTHLSKGVIISHGRPNTLNKTRRKPKTQGSPPDPTTGPVPLP